MRRRVRSEGGFLEGEFGQALSLYVRQIMHVGDATTENARQMEGGGRGDS